MIKLTEKDILHGREFIRHMLLHGRSVKGNRQHIILDYLGSQVEVLHQEFFSHVYMDLIGPDWRLSFAFGRTVYKSKKDSFGNVLKYDEHYLRETAMFKKFIASYQKEQYPLMNSHNNQMLLWYIHFGRNLRYDFPRYENVEGFREQMVLFKLRENA